MFPQKKHSESVVQSYSVKKASLKILQNSQENTCAESFSNKVTGAEACKFIEKETQEYP